MSVRKFVLPGIAVAALVATGAGIATTTVSEFTGSFAGTASRTGTHDHGAPALPAGDGPGKGDITYLAASLLGRNEVPAADGKATGDRDGRAQALVRIQGDRLWYAIRWQDVAAPTAGHIHLGSAGVNGAIKVPFFAGALPETSRAVAGSVRVTDRTALAQLKKNPVDFYANLHTGEFPGGAVRGQFHRLNRPADLNGIMNGGASPTLQSLSDGAQEVPNKEGKATGDPDGRATAFARSHDAMVSWSFTWTGIAAPTIGHIHRGPKGANGPIAADLFSAPRGLPAGVTGLAGMTQVGPATAERIMADPAGHYTNLHTAEFPGGAVRGHLAPVTGTQPKAFAKPVLRGAQIYRCTPQPDGGHAFTQDGVTAVLGDGIAHSFVKPGPSGPPQWIAPDRSAVTGKAVTKSFNGDGNIPELVLDATQTGAKRGLLSGTSQILRLNTIGGAAPSGPCAPGTTTRVPYRADYLFMD
ncbi:CHRD domain-containing protein [Spirillospora sp. NPDC029432]|uniref:CHRD domain-containing protein n=1 Tax=Spirillospora sp. NPDC029432 TaxID=3154599 RepID=UPI003455C01A